MFFGNTLTFEQYVNNYPEHWRNGKVTCARCGGSSIHVRAIQETFTGTINHHVCRGCGVVLYHSQSRAIQDYKSADEHKQPCCQKRTSQLIKSALLSGDTKQVEILSLDIERQSTRIAELIELAELLDNSEAISILKAI